MSETPSYADQIARELESCEKPRIIDVGTTSGDDVVRDLHRVLLGNGNPTKGMLFKHAETRVDVSNLKSSVEAIKDSVRELTQSATEIRRQKQYRRNISRVLWDNKGFIIVATAIILAQVIGFMRQENFTDATRRLKSLEKKVTKIVSDSPLPGNN